MAAYISNTILRNDTENCCLEKPLLLKKCLINDPRSDIETAQAVQVRTSFDVDCSQNETCCNLQQNCFLDKIKESIANSIFTLKNHIPCAQLEDIQNETTLQLSKTGDLNKIADTLNDLTRTNSIVEGDIVIAAADSVMIWHLNMFHERLKVTGTLLQESKETTTQKLCEAMSKAGLKIDESLASENLVRSVGSLTGRRVVPISGRVVGETMSALMIGYHIDSRALNPLVGPYTGRFFSQFFKHEDRLVVAREIEIGDHLIIHGNYFHPKCHVIVVEKATDAFLVIRNTYERGVFKDTIKFYNDQEFSKVMYPHTATVPPNVTVIRATSQLGRHFYDLFENNCEDFVYWCKIRS